MLGNKTPEQNPFTENGSSKNGGKTRMMHKVTCMDCGKTERIEVEHGKPIKSGWGYFGKLNVNACQTSKYFLKPIDQKNIAGKCERIPNKCYDPKVEPKFVELWSCPVCSVKEERMIQKSEG